MMMMLMNEKHQKRRLVYASSALHHTNHTHHLPLEEASVSWKSVTRDFRKSAIIFTGEGEQSRLRQMIIKGNLSRRIVNAAAFSVPCNVKMVII